MVVLWVILGIIVIVVIWVIMIYNRLVHLSNMKDEAWSGIDVQLKRRFDLVPNLVEAVKGYAAHEKETLDNVTKARSMISSAGNIDGRIEGENMLTGALKSLFAVSESYPALRANENFMHLQGELSNLENDIQMSRRYYNGSARDYNIGIQNFPAVLIAGKLGYMKSPYFEVEEQAKAAPSVKF